MLPDRSLRESPGGLEPPANRLLLALEPAEWAALHLHVETVELVTGSALYDIGAAAEWVVFPKQGLLSLTSLLESGREIETAVVGRDGAAGVVEAIGGGVMSNRLVVQVPGWAYRVPAKRYCDAFVNSPALRTAVYRYLELVLAEARQAVACLKDHSAAARFSCRVLDCQELSGTTQVLPLKQDDLAMMLGLQRTTVSGPRWSGAPARVGRRCRT